MRQIDGEDHLAGNQRPVQADTRHAALYEIPQHIGATSAEGLDTVPWCTAHTRAADFQERLWDVRRATAEHPH